MFGTILIDVDDFEFDDRLARLRENLEQASKLLDAHGDDQWSGWATRCLGRLRTHDATAFEHILGAFGGKGSFNDVVVLPVNGHVIEPEDVPAVNEQLHRLRIAIREDASALARTLRS